MNLEQTVARHYAHGSLERAILEALAAAGKDVNRLSPADLAPVDEFHVGGRPATVAFAEQLGVHSGMRLLDVGCGLGGAARYFAHEHGCHVTGIDLSDEYVAVANALAARVGLGDLVSCQQGSALALPFTPGSFDAAYLLHVGMNIENKSGLFAQIRRVLAPSGTLGIYDVMRLGAGELSYPVPWAGGPEASFVADAATYRRLLEAGVDVVPAPDGEADPVALGHDDGGRPDLHVQVVDLPRDERLLFVMRVVGPVGQRERGVELAVRDPEPPLCNRGVGVQRALKHDLLHVRREHANGQEEVGVRGLR